MTVTTFPELLNYSFFAPTLLRLAAACAFLYIAYTLWNRRDAISRKPFPLIGAQSWPAPLAAVAFAALSFALFCGYYTQWAAILGIIPTLKSLLFARRFPMIFPLSRVANLLLLAILLSLLLTGAGAFAFDVPL